MERYFLQYASLEQQRWMISDEARTTAFAHAIAESVKPGDVVIDVGAGTGILSLFAARAGARRVIAVERSGMAELARELIAHNGMQEQVEVFEGDAKDLVLDEKADVIVSEWLGHMAYVENMFEVVRHIRDEHLKAGGLMIPSGVDLLLAPMDGRSLHEDDGPGFWLKGPIHGVDFSCFAEQEMALGFVKKLPLSHEELLGPGTVVHELDTLTAKPGDEWSSGSVVLAVTRDGTVNGLAGWFSARLSPGVLLDTSPHSTLTHWEHNFFPFHPMPARAGESLTVDFRFDDGFQGSRIMEVDLEMGGKAIHYVVD